MESSNENKPSHRVLGVIPARWASTRFPGKPLHQIAGKPLVRHVWEQCRLCEALDDVVVATDDSRIADAVAAFGGQAVMTSPDHPTGTDRIAEVVETFPEHHHILNIQGDEPLIEPETISRLVEALAGPEQPDMVTAANELKLEDPEVNDPNVVKVVIGTRHQALYFSRSPIPYPRQPGTEGFRYLRHKGIYGYTRDFLLRFVSWEPTVLERVEGLEQLRALENGATIGVIITTDLSPGIDTPEQAAILERQLATE